MLPSVALADRDPRPVAMLFLVGVSAFACSAAVVEASDGSSTVAELFCEGARASRDVLRRLAIKDDLLSKVTVGLANVGLIVAQASLRSAPAGT